MISNDLKLRAHYPLNCTTKFYYQSIVSLTKCGKPFKSTVEERLSKSKEKNIAIESPVNFGHVCFRYAPVNLFTQEIFLDFSGLGSYSLQANGMKCLIFIGCLTVRFGLS